MLARNDEPTASFARPEQKRTDPETMMASPQGDLARLSADIENRALPETLTQDSDEEFYLQLGAAYFGRHLEPRSVFLTPLRDPAKPWLGPFPCSDGLSGPFALQQTCFAALRTVVSGSAALHLGQRLAVELRDPATQLAGASADVRALGDELRALARAHGFHTDDPR